MARITTLSQPIKFEGQPLPLQGAAFLANVVSIARQSPNGQGFITSTNGFFAFDALEPGVIYFVRSWQVPYDIPETGLTTVPELSSYVYSQNISTATVPMIP